MTAPKKKPGHHRCPPWCHVCPDLKTKGGAAWESVLPRCFGVAAYGATPDWRAICTCDHPESFRGMSIAELQEAEQGALHQFRDATQRLRAIRAALRKKPRAKILGMARRAQRDLAS